MIRVGLGYDIHRIKARVPLVLGGIDIPSPFGLEGHSDADVLLHAIMDALLGGAALGDIGDLFPPTDARYRGISSLHLLSAVRILVRDAGYEIGNIDAVVVAESPQIAPYRDAIRTAISATLGIPISDVSIKATTNEMVGTEGRLEAISVQAVALLRRSA